MYYIRFMREKVFRSIGKEKRMSRKIGVISDTHIPHFKGLPDAVWQHFADVELIIHHNCGAEAAEFTSGEEAPPRLTRRYSHPCDGWEYSTAREFPRPCRKNARSV